MFFLSLNDYQGSGPPPTGSCRDIVCIQSLESFTNLTLCMQSHCVQTSNVGKRSVMLMLCYSSMKNNVHEF